MTICSMVSYLKTQADVAVTILKVANPYSSGKRWLWWVLQWQLNALSWKGSTWHLLKTHGSEPVKCLYPTIREPESPTQHYSQEWGNHRSNWHIIGEIIITIAMKLAYHKMSPCHLCIVHGLSPKDLTQPVLQSASRPVSDSLSFWPLAYLHLQSCSSPKT